ncbi:MAG: GatB/YqeY domain-containing protein [Deltaproteobacteria bacterium]|nr:MAG: GatB/YqeY domain-containing protein [Deltaproteobacteria bacterium]
MLRETLTTDMKAAMKSRDQARLDTIRMLLSALKNEEISLRRPMNGEEEIAFLSSQAKRRRESITAFEEAGRDEMARTERAELEVINAYLPEQLSAEEARSIIAEVIAAVGASAPSDLGRVMGAVMPKLKGRFPGSDVRPIVQELLAGNG